MKITNYELKENLIFTSFSKQNNLSSRNLQWKRTSLPHFFSKIITLPLDKRSFVTYICGAINNCRGVVRNAPNKNY